MVRRRKTRTRSVNMMRWVRIFSFNFLVILLFRWSEGTWNRSIRVSPNGSDNATCVRKNSTCSLHYALNYEADNSTEILIVPGNYHLGNATTFANLTDLALVRFGRGVVNISCEKGAGLAFEFCENILLQGITLHKCGSLHNSSTGSAFGWRAHIQFYSAIFVVYTKNFSMNDSHIVQSRGIGLNMYDVGGVVTVEQSRFEENGPDSNCSELDGIAMAGGGIYLELTSSGGLPPFTPWSGKASYDSNSLYRFSDCTFEKNSAPESCFSSDIEIPGGEDHFPFGRGGGLSIFVKAFAENNLYQVDNCSFVNNSALWGAGFFMEFQDRTQKSMLTVIGSNFSNNRAKYAGGATRTGLIMDNKHRLLLENKILFEDCTFTNNSAALGGGVSHCQSRYVPANKNDIRTVEFKGCTWTNNEATMGSAIGLSTGAVFSGLEQNHSRIPYFFSMSNCEIHENRIVETEDGIVLGQGALYTYALPVIFKGNTTFQANDNTAVVLDNTVLQINDSVYFLKNTGFQGGALSIYGQSKLILMPYSELHFIRNIADEKGGAIYVQRSGPPVVAFDTTELLTHGCFLWYNNSGSLKNVSHWQTNVIFQDNEASSGGGNSIYAATLQGCRKTGEHRMNNSVFEWDFIKYKNTNSKVNIQDEISTDPIMINLTEHEWSVAPSEVFNASIKLIDEKNSSVRGVVKLSFSRPSVRLDAPSQLLLVQDIKKDSKVSGLSLQGQDQKPFNVCLRTVGSQDISKSIKDMSLNKCNPGFKQNDNHCDCLPTTIDGIAGCAKDGKSVNLRTGFWGGKVNGNFTVFPCPPHYCKEQPKNASTFVYSKEDMCSGYRNNTSILCGECQKGYSVNLGDEKCSRKCDYDHLWYLLLYSVVILVMVLVILRIDMDIFTTYLNSWLYSYQVILVLLDEGEQLDKFISSIIGITNGQVPGVSGCLFRGMNNVHKHGINYLLPAYVLLLLIVLGKIARRWPSCYINRNVYRAFCTLLVLCYTNVTSISIELIHWVHLKGKWVLFTDGNIDWNDWRQHLPFTIIAVAWIVFFVIPIPLMLLFTPWFLRKFPFLQNFRLYFDNFQQCFKVKYRWFAAFYFICRFYILMVALWIPIGPLKWSILEVSCVLIVVICVYIQPYNDDYAWLNTLDAVLLTNICCITIFSSGKNSEASDAVLTGLGTTVNVLAYLPLVYFVVLLGYSGWNYFCPSDPSAYVLENKSGDADDLETSSSRPLDTHNAYA